MQAFAFLVAVAGGYLIGSVSFAVVVSRMMGLADPRSYGSGNPGATNVLRSGNRVAAALTLVLDALKGWLPVFLVLQFGPRFGLGETAAAFAGLGAFVGHLWPVFFRLRGGKGVATAAGVLLGVNLPLGLACLATWALVAALTRYSSLAALVTAVCAPFYQALVWGLEPLLLALAGMSLLLIWRHEANIRKLLAGTESKLGGKAAAPAAAVSAAPATARSRARRARHAKKGH